LKNCQLIKANKISQKQFGVYGAWYAGYFYYWDLVTLGSENSSKRLNWKKSIYGNLKSNFYLGFWAPSPGPTNSIIFQDYFFWI
jgi:hypothetical protein